MARLSGWHPMSRGPEGARANASGASWRKRAVLAAGALERPVAFRNNDRPGIMMAGAVRAYVNRWCVSPGRSVAVFGNNDTRIAPPPTCWRRACMSAR